MSKILSFMKKNIYYLLLGLCVLAIATIIIVAIAVANNKPSVPAGGGNNIVNPPPGGDTEIPVVEIIFDVPVRTGTIGMDYSNTISVWNATMKREEMHKGIDFLADLGTDVYCTFDGTVVDISHDLLFGTIVTIDHGDGLRSVYKSLDQTVNVQKGNRVRKGDVIGKVGASLFEVLEGPHIHYEVLKNNSNVSPYDYLLNAEK